MNDGSAVSDEWCVTAKKMLLQFAGKIQLPNRLLKTIVSSYTRGLKKVAVNCVILYTGCQKSDHNSVES